MFNNSIEKQTDFEFTKVVISPDCQKIAVYDATNYLTIYDMKTKQELAKFKENELYIPSNIFLYKMYHRIDDSQFKFTFDSKKLVLRTSQEELKIFNIEKGEFEEKHFYPSLRQFYLSKSDYAIALFIDSAIIIRRGKDQEIKLYESNSVWLGDFCLNFPNIFCYSTEQKTMNIWNFKSGQLTNIKTETLILSLRFSDSGKKIIAYMYNKKVKIYVFDPVLSLDEPIYQKPAKIIDLPGSNYMEYVTISSKEDLILALSNDNEEKSCCLVALYIYGEKIQKKNIFWKK